MREPGNREGDRRRGGSGADGATREWGVGWEQHGLGVVELVTESDWTADVKWAYRLGGSLLSEGLPRRWAHTLGVSRRAVGCGGGGWGGLHPLCGPRHLHPGGWAPPLSRAGGDT